MMKNFKVTMTDPDNARITQWGDVEVMTYHVDIDVDESLLPDDEWRSVFYNMYTLKEVAEHIVWNRIVRGFREVEGYADKDEGVHWVINKQSSGFEECDGSND